MKVTLTGLKPDHRYAVYVETDTVADADIGAHSNITYTRTKPYSECPRMSVSCKLYTHVVTLLKTRLSYFFYELNTYSLN